MNKYEATETLRNRLLDAMDHKAVSKSELARLTGVDRSTISMILNDQSPRMPSSFFVANAARQLEVSADWLLGLSDRPQVQGELLFDSLLSKSVRTLDDPQLFQWLNDIAGQKLRDVPAGLPGAYKTKDYIEWEYSRLDPSYAETAYHASLKRFHWIEDTRTEYEIAIPLREVLNCRDASGFYEDAPKEVRFDQLLNLAQHCEERYPRLRLSIFATRKNFCAPIAIYGTRVATVYIGSFYIAFREKSRVQALSEQFNFMVRNAVIRDRDVPKFLRDLVG